MTDDGIDEPYPVNKGRAVHFAFIFFLAALTFVVPGVGHTHLFYDTEAHSPRTLSPSPISYEFFGFEIPEEAFPVDVVFVGEPAAGLDHADVEDAIRGATSAWNRVPCSYARLQWAGVRDSFDDVADDEIAVSFTDDFGDIPHTIAQFTWPNPSPPLGIDIYLNTLTYDWALEPRFFPYFHHAERPTIALSAALAHELGHALGLDHTDVHNAATMAPHYLVDGSQDELSADDKLGLCALYPRSGNECIVDAHCRPRARCVSGEHGDVCDIPLGDVGDYCAWELQHCRDFCHIEHPATGSGFCTAECGDDADCPPHYLCAENDGDGAHCRVDSDDPPPQNGCVSIRSPATWPLIALCTLIAIALRRRSPWWFTTRSLRASH